MGTVTNNSSGHVENDRTGVSQAGAAATPQRSERQTVTYQVILRHLAKFRDGATALLDLFKTHAPAAGTDQAAPPLPAAPAAAIPKTVEAEPKSPLQLRIDRHLSKVDEALRQIASMNPEQEQKGDFPPEMRDQIRTKERTIHDIVGAELHFWAATIEQNPLAKFDQTEQAWILWIILLAKIIGVDAEHKEHLDFLEDWASHEDT
jgi:hypothetical protein